MKALIEEQIAELEQTIAWRRANRQLWMDREKLSDALADRKTTYMASALATLKFVAKHKDAIKTVIAVNGDAA